MRLVRQDVPRLNGSESRSPDLSLLGRGAGCVAETGLGKSAATRDINHSRSGVFPRHGHDRDAIVSGVGTFASGEPLGRHAGWRSNPSTMGPQPGKLYVVSTISKDQTGDNDTVCSKLLRAGPLFHATGLLELKAAREESSDESSDATFKYRKLDVNDNDGSSSSSDDSRTPGYQDLDSLSPVPITYGNEHGIRKKNARFDISPEITLNNIDDKIKACTDDEERKVLKQQKRLLRNRQAALDSRQRKKEHSERLEREKSEWQKREKELLERIAVLEIELQVAKGDNRRLADEIRSLERTAE
jgi:hypothetical protein